MSEVRRRRAGTAAWVLLVLASMVLIGYGIVRADWYIWLPNPAEQEESWTGTFYIFAGCALSLAAAVWSGARESPAWVTICVGLPGALVSWAALDNPYDLKRFVAAVVAFPLALAGMVGGIRARRRLQTEPV
jgi:hypothetical protein